MKKVLLLIPAFLLAFQISKAQTEKGSQTLGVNVGFNYQKSKNLSINPYDNSSFNSTIKTTGFSIGPNYSYFIADKLDIGANLNYAGYSLDDNSPNYPTNRDSHEYSAQIFLRKYFMYGNKLGIRTGPYFGYGRYNTKYTYSGADVIYNNSEKINGYSAGINLGLVYYPSKSLGVSANLANLSYNHTKSDNDKQGNGSSDNFNANFISNNLALSVFYVFSAK
jgi:hypothetical protein